MFVLAAEAADSEPKTESLAIVTSGGKQDFTVEIARTPAEQAKGLMFRTSMAADHGMLFVHSRPGPLTMWMRNTYISLDMVFIRKDGSVHHIARNTVPMSEEVISSQGDVVAVLELKAGTAERLGIKPGDKVVHSHFEP